MTWRIRLGALAAGVEDRVAEKDAKAAVKGKEWRHTPVLKAWEESCDRRDSRKYQPSRAADPRRRKVEQSSETSITESSEAESHQHTSSEPDSDDDSEGEGERKEAEEPPSSDEVPSLRESRKRADQKKGSQTKDH